VCLGSGPWPTLPREASAMWMKQQLLHEEVQQLHPWQGLLCQGGQQTITTSGDVNQPTVWIRSSGKSALEEESVLTWASGGLVYDCGSAPTKGARGRTDGRCSSP
jgi:hypothetical protein